MIKSLRKRLLQIWALWAVLIPVGIFIAWMAVPEKVTQQLLQDPQANTILTEVEKIKLKNYTIKILIDSVNRSTSKLYLEFINEKELSAPSLLIYQLIYPNEKNIDKQLLLGRVDIKGSKVFPLDFPSSDPIIRNSLGFIAKFVLYDFISKNVIDTISIKTLPFKPIDASNF